MQPQPSEPAGTDSPPADRAAVDRVWGGRWLTLSAGCLFLGVWLIALSAGGKKKKPAPDGIVVDNPVVDLGQIRQGTTHTISFHIRNTTSSAVSLALAWSSCDCTKVEVPTQPLPPGGELDLPMTWRIGGHRGVCGSRILLAAQSDTGVVTEIVLRVQGDVVPDVGLSPKELEFTRGESATKQIAVGPLLGAHGESIESVYCCCGYLRADFDAREQVIRVSYDAAADSRDSDSVTLEIRTASRNEPTIRYKVWLVHGEND